MDEDKKVSVKVSDECASNEIGSLLLAKMENSYESYDEYEEYSPVEIKDSGKCVLSTTEKGISYILLEPHFFKEAEASELMNHLLKSTEWQRKNVTIRGVEYPQPRLVAWYGEVPYSYSGTTLEPAKMPDCIIQIKKKIEKYLTKQGINFTFNSVLLNLYRHNRDSVSWHSDDEIGVLPTIASLSLGETRRFEMRRKLKNFEDESSYDTDDEYDEYCVQLSNGFLIIMDGSMQLDWQHRVPKEYYTVKNPRINLTFRRVNKMESSPFPDTEIKNPPLEKVTETSSIEKTIYEEKSLKSDSNAACSDIVCKTEDLSSPLKTTVDSSKSGEKDFESVFKTDVKIKNETGNPTEISSYNKIALKTEDALGESDNQSPKVSKSASCTNLSNFTYDKRVAKSIDNDSYKKISGDTETDSYIKKTLKTEDKLNKPYEEPDPQLCYGKRSLINITEDEKKAKSIDNYSKYSNKVTNPDAIARKRKRFRTNSHNTACFENNTYESFDLKHLLDKNVNVMDYKTFFEYAAALRRKVLQNIDDFQEPEKSELEVYCQLTDGTQTKKNQKIITRRICYIADKVLRKNS